MTNGPKNGMWPSPFNREPAPAIEPGRQVFVADCTLRDGEQQAGIVLDRAAKVAIARALDDLGVYEIEAGTVASSEEDRLAMMDMCQLGLKAKISTLCRGINADIDKAAELGIWGVRLSFPISEIERKYKLKGISDGDYLKRALELCEYSRRKGLYVVFSPYDTTRAEIPFLRRLVSELAKAGTVDRLRIVDTTGCASPQAITYIVGEVRSAAPKLALEIHCHNDFGLACANTLAGVAAGADFVSTTINGIGERCGNAATEEVVMALEVLYGVHCGIDLTRLTEVSRLVSELSGVRTQLNKAVVGEGAFRHESGMAVAGLLQDPFTAESYEPELVGQTRQILLGKKSGLASITYKLKEMGLPVPEDQLPALLDRVKAVAVSNRRFVTDQEFKQIVDTMIQ